MLTVSTFHKKRSRASPTTGLGPCRTSDPVDAPSVDLFASGAPDGSPTCLAGWATIAPQRSVEARFGSRRVRRERRVKPVSHRVVREEPVGRPGCATHDLAFRSRGTAQRAGGGLIPNSGESARLGLPADVERRVANSSDTRGNPPRSRLSPDALGDVRRRAESPSVGITAGRRVTRRSGGSP